MEKANISKTSLGIVDVPFKKGVIEFHVATPLRSKKYNRRQDHILKRYSSNLSLPINEALI